MAQLVKTLGGLAIASVKTVGGLAVASVKTIGGLDNTSGGGGPTLVAQDNFDSYIDGDALGGQGNWIDEAVGINVRVPGADGSVNPGNSNVGLSRYNVTFAANQRAEMTIDAVGTGGGFDWIGPAVRIQSGAATGYAVVFSSTDLYLLTFNAGTVTTVNSDSAVTLIAGNKIAIEATGSGTSTRLKVEVDTGSGWVTKWASENPAVDIDGGQPGVGKWLLASLTNRADDWKGYDL